MHADNTPPRIFQKSKLNVPNQSPPSVCTSMTKQTTEQAYIIR